MTTQYCLSLDCPERKSVCCSYTCRGAGEGEKLLGVTEFFCSKCGKEFESGKCTASYKCISDTVDSIIGNPFTPNPCTAQVGSDGIEEQLFEIVETVRIPNHKDWGDNGSEEMSLFDITMDAGKGEEEGIVLVEKLLTFFNKIHDSAYSAGRQSVLDEMEKVNKPLDVV